VGWTQKGKLVVPDGSDDPGVADIDGEKKTPTGLIVKQDYQGKVQSAPVPATREIKRFIVKMKKKGNKEANKKFLEERFGYLRQSKPKVGTATSVIKGEQSL
jgi:hypothetical protein